MDRNGKKPKATRGDAALHLERSDTKAHARDTLRRDEADAPTQGVRSSGKAERGRARTTDGRSGAAR